MPLLLMFIFYFASSSWWSVQTSDLDTNLRGVSVAITRGDDAKHYAIWASGSNEVVLRSIDDGKTWKRLTVSGGDDLDFRDIEAFSADVAYVMSAGEGDKSRIYKTTDGGNNWQLQYSDKRAGFFLDSLACDSPKHCVALSDPVDGKFVVISTNDGEHWREFSRGNMPAALPKEGAFAASGSAIALCDGKIFFVTGGPSARIFRSTDRGNSWTVRETPITSGNASSGAFSIACEGRDNLVVVGGDYKDPNNPKQTAAYSNNSGETWHLSESLPGGFRSAVVSFSRNNFVAVGPTGTDLSFDGGIHWQHADDMNLNALSFAGKEGWAVGPRGTVVCFNPQANPRTSQ